MSAPIDNEVNQVPDWLADSTMSFVRQRGRTFDERMGDWERWLDARREHDVWPFSRVLSGRPGSHCLIADENANEPRACLNFGSQDYLSLSSHPAVIESAVEACKEFGVHSAGSAVVAGRTHALYLLEQRLAEILRKEACLVFPTGWAAGFGVVAGLVRRSDAIVVDNLAHSCLSEGVRHCGCVTKRFSHNDLDELEDRLRDLRQENRANGLFIVIESLYSMDSDCPDLGCVTELAQKYDAITILDVAHDFGAMGKTGRGLLDATPVERWPDLIMGSFSKTFASNGGFVAGPKQVVDYLRLHSPSFTFSNALSPPQTLVVHKCLDIVFSEQGSEMRDTLMCRITTLRQGMADGGFEVGGTPSPIVPVFVGDESLSRLTFRRLEPNGLLANLAEFPAVPKGLARFRFQVMRLHTDDETIQASQRMRAAYDEAKLEHSH